MISSLDKRNRLIGYLDRIFGVKSRDQLFVTNHRSYFLVALTVS